MPSTTDQAITRFDPTPGEPYARCLEEGCGFVADTKETMSEHSSSTMRPTGETVGITEQGHRYRVLNPSREDALRHAVMRAADDALESAAQEFCDDVYNIHTRDGISLAELTSAVGASEFSNAWAEYISGEEEDHEEPAADAPNEQLHQDSALFDPSDAADTD